MKEIKGLRPFTRFLMTIGELPSSYLVSMTYEEQLLWLCNYLQNIVIPTVNNNGEAVKELQDLFIELKDYVDNYFDNLDVQEEINSKLDDMADSGELATIMADYINMNAVFVYDTIDDMASIQTIGETGSVYCLGKDTYDDGKGAFYKIRAIEAGDVPDGYNIVSLTNIADTIAERLPNYEINEINDKLDTLTDTTIPGIEDDITTINETTIPNLQSTLEAEISALADKKWIFIGDSYSQGYTPDGSVTGWSTLLKNKMNLTNDTCLIADHGGAGFANTSYPYLQIITNLDADNDVTDILIAGGYNDTYYPTSEVLTGITNCKTLLNTKFPNAKIHIAFIGGTSNEYHRYILRTITLYNDKCNELGIKYLPNLQYILFNKDYLSSDGIHPNQDGEAAIANGLYAALNGSYTYAIDRELSIDPSYSDHFSSSSSFTFRLRSVNNSSNLSTANGAGLSTSTPFSVSNNAFISLGKIEQKGLMGSYAYNTCFNIGEVIIHSTTTPAGYYNCEAQLFIQYNGMVWLHLMPKINEEHTNYQTFGGVDNIQINYFSIDYLTDVM